METIVSVIRKILQTKILVPEELNKIENTKCLSQIVLLEAKKKWKSIKNQEASTLELHK